MNKLLCLAVGSVVLSGCASLPSSGPTSQNIIQASAHANNFSTYRVIDITPQMVGTVAQSGGQKPSGRFSLLSRSASRGISVGDTLTITVFESGTGGLFAPQTDGNTSGAPRLNLPPQMVESSGKITVPYAGAIQAAGRTPQQIQKTIQQRLASRAIEPQAIVTVTGNDGRMVTVNGDVEKGGRVPLTVGNERLLDVVASAGGPRSPAYETVVKLTRGGHSQEMVLQRVVNSPTDNIALQPGDQIIVSQNPQKFVALGASISNSEVPFGSESLNLAEAIGKVGGLDDRRADPAGVFVFRFEDVGTYNRLTGEQWRQSGRIGVVYRLDLKQPNRFLAAQQFPVRDKDILYFANSPSTEISKFFAILNSGASATSSTAMTVAKVAP